MNENENPDLDLRWLQDIKVGDKVIEIDLYHIKPRQEVRTVTGVMTDLMVLLDSGGVYRIEDSISIMYDRCFIMKATPERVAEIEENGAKWALRRIIDKYNLSDLSIEQLQQIVNWLQDKENNND